ncbi:hypothetical protein [Lentibacillus sp. CBA3610]|uniref:hypothetical protein n=1 Tax=Lentibacillus sp. CBA3610 TaxID=2518176 RepID=UPI0015955778|nr:hypothetical protein [Lentibacillus sp. CBA3610]QKY71459.1 hypothetical protein Len3610_19660 [Lentibacillus sp. CBA3610]
MPLLIKNVKSSLDNIDEQAAKALIKKYGFQKLIAEFPNETCHYQPEYWAKEIFENSTIRLT